MIRSLIAKNPERAAAFAAAVILGGVALAVTTQFPEDGLVMSADEERVVRYAATNNAADPVALFQRKLETGKATLEYDPNLGYLPSVLKAFGVPISSQLLVFSKTSSQAPHTSPKTPRALYFNDEVFVGFAQGAGDLDLAAIDPKKGPVFYTLDQSDPAKPKFTRRNDCMSCHIAPKTLDVPGLLVRSVFTEPSGAASAMVDGFVSGHNNPLRDRWGGWYVTGTHGKDTHLGNVFIKEKDHKTADLSKSSNLTSLKDRIDTSKYLSPDSDAVALLVLDHAVRMQVYLTKARYETLFGLDENARAPDDKRILDWTNKRISESGEALLAYMLFRDEAPLKGPIVGTSSFQKDFVKQGPRDRKGRSLREFDLKKRVFRYPCSYLVYSETFDALPPEMKSYLWRRLDEILVGGDQRGLFAKMDAADRKAVLEILLDTKPEFKAWMRSKK